MAFSSLSDNLPQEILEKYNSKIVSAEAAARLINSGDHVFASGVNSGPVELFKALCERKDELTDVRITSGIIMHPYECFKPEFRGRIEMHSLFFGPLEKMSYKGGNVTLTPLTFGYAYALFEQELRPNVLSLTVTPPNAEGLLSFGPCGGIMNAKALETAEKVILVANENLPFVPGENNVVHIDRVDALVESTYPIPAVDSPEPTDIDKKVAANILPFINDGDTFQIGIGGIPNAIAYSLDNKKDLGVHTEMLTDSIVHLAKIGVVTGAKKNHHPGKIVFAFASGSQELLDFTHNNPDLHIVDLKEAVNCDNAGKNDNFVSINTCIMIDITGQVASESIGFQQISGSGGQLDFVRAAHKSKGGRSFMAMPSTNETKSGVTSNIVLALPAGTVVTTPRTEVAYVVTEYGVADLRFKTTEERAKALIAIAHPDFRNELTAQATEAGVIRR